VCDSDRDGFVSADDLFVLAASRLRRAPGIWSGANVSKNLNPEDFYALLEPRGAQYVDVDTLLGLMEEAQAPDGQEGWETAAMALLQEHFSKLDRQRRVAPSAQSFRPSARSAAVPARREPLRCVVPSLACERLALASCPSVRMHAWWMVGDARLLLPATCFVLSAW
jgi:hypothetical protein